MTEAVPMTIPRPVSSDRTGFARRAWTLNLSASARNKSAPLRHLEELQSVVPGRILGRQFQGHVFPEEILRNLQILLLLDKNLCLCIDDLRLIRMGGLGLGHVLV